MTLSLTGTLSLTQLSHTYLLVAAPPVTLTVSFFLSLPLTQQPWPRTAVDEHDDERHDDPPAEHTRSRPLQSPARRLSSLAARLKP